MTWVMTLVLLYSCDLVLCVFGGLRIDPRDWHRRALTLTCVWPSLLFTFKI